MITLQDITIRFGGEMLFSGVSFQVQRRDRIGLVGLNGSGKSTLLKVMYKEIRPDEGKVTMSADTTLGYLPQQILVKDSRSVYEEAASALEELNSVEKQLQKLNDEIVRREDYHSERYLKLTEKIATLSDQYHLLGGETREREITRTLFGLGFTSEDMSRPTEEFSGGWRMRIEIAKILLKKPSLLLLDEPTNHLDIESIQWLEDYFNTYPGALVLVSHDKALLDHVTLRTLEIENGRVTPYPVPFSRAMKQKEERRIQQVAAWKNQQKMIATTESFIERFRYKATKAAQVQSRIKQLEKLERLPEPSYGPGKVHVTFGKTLRSGDIVVSAEHLSKKYGSHQVLENVDLVIRRGEKIALVGKNGQGKTTLVRLLLGEIKGEGAIRLGTKVNVGYYAQDAAGALNPDLTVLETVEEQAGPEMRPHIRNMLGAFLFSGDQTDKKVRVLSGGERSRLALLTLLLQPVNFLVMDEPTHHLDMQTKEILKQALLQFDGTLLLVSHDRDFLDGLVTLIYVVRERQIKAYDGDIYRYLKEFVWYETEPGKKGPEVPPYPEEKGGKPERKKAYLHRKQMMREVDKARKKIEHLEKEIEKLENDKHLLYEHINALSKGEKDNDPDLFEKFDRLSQNLDSKMEEWEERVQELEQFKQENT